MKLCRITGDVVSTVKNPRLAGHKILVCQPVDLDGRTPQGPSFLALDVVQAGITDLVLTIKEGSGARLIFGDDKIPLAAVVVAVVDELEVEDEARLVGTSLLELNQQSALSGGES
ncbi:MAG: EutN/CcmL family microcompartment protein [Planctomycetota bacterium]